MMHVSIPAVRRLGIVLASIGLVFTLTAPVYAQDGEIIPGTECVTEPRPVTFLGDLVSTPVAAEDYQAPTGVPEGEAPDDATIAEIEATVRQFIACSNSGDVLRALALLDDDYLRRTIDPSGELDPATANELVESLATPIAMTDEQLVILIDIQEMVQLPDGTVAVVLETDGGQPNPEGTDVDLFVFERVGDRWIIVDAVNDIDDIEAHGTPESGL